MYMYNIHYIYIYTHYFGDFLSSKIMTPCYSDHSPFFYVFERVPLVPTDSHDKNVRTIPVSHTVMLFMFV